MAHVCSSVAHPVSGLAQHALDAEHGLAQHGLLAENSLLIAEEAEDAQAPQS